MAPQLVPLTPIDERVLAVTRELDRSHVNGGTIVGCYQFTNEHLRGTQQRLGLADPPPTLLLECLRDSDLVSELQIPPSLDDVHDFELQGTFQLEGLLIQRMLGGGAYEQFRGTEDEARQLARECVEAMVLNNRGPAMGYVSHQPWCGWFFDVAWDYTIVVNDAGNARWWLLCLTDTD